jgi:hypothetical protein
VRFVTRQEFWWEVLIQVWAFNWPGAPPSWFFVHGSGSLGGVSDRVIIRVIMYGLVIMHKSAKKDKT